RRRARVGRGAPFVLLAGDQSPPGPFRRGHRLPPPPPAVSASERQSAERILGAVGATVWVEREEQMDAITAVSGSGPAYVFYFTEALEQAARELGLPADTARKLALETFAGGARLALDSSDPVAALRERVTSKGGTTERALKS